MKNKLNSLITQTKNITKQLLTTFIVLAITIIGGNFIVKAFTEPTQSPEDWTPTPLASSPWISSSTDIYYTDGNVGIGTMNPQAKLDVNGTIIASTPTADNEVATKSYVDAAGGGSGGGVYTLWGSTSCHNTDILIKSGRAYFVKFNYGWDNRGMGGLAGPICILAGDIKNGSYSGNNLSFENHIGAYYINCVVCKIN